MAVYGRRRVGKTFLVNELFHDDVVFHHTGLSPYDRQRRVSTKDQLQNFYFSLIRHGMEGISQPKSWLEAFFLLEKFLGMELSIWMMLFQDLRLQIANFYYQNLQISL